MSPLTVDFHPSVRNPALQRAAIASLQANRMDPKSLYVTPLQAALWREVFFKHSPIHGNPEFARIYRDAFAQILDRFGARKSLLVGLGCGTGAKELDLWSNLKAHGQDAVFAAIDISSDLVLESVEKLVDAGAGHRHSLVCDLAETVFLSEWLDGLENQLPRLITFFGLAPNLAPSEVVRLFRSVLRPGDTLLVSAHLAPVQENHCDTVDEAMNRVLPQYDNPETLAWLTAGVDHWNLAHLVEPPKMTTSEIEGIPAFVGQARWKTSEPFEQWGQRFSLKWDEPLRLFTSLRYTPPLFETMLRTEGLSMELLSITACRQEAIWCVRNC